MGNMFVHAAKQRAHQAFRAVHLVSPVGFFSVLQISCMLPVAITAEDGATGVGVHRERNSAACLRPTRATR
jgi:hypothetical protein